MFSHIVIVGFVEKIRRFAQDKKVMGKPIRKPFFFILCAQVHAHPLSRGGQIFSEGGRNVINFALSGSSQFTLRLLNLIMQAAQDILALLGILCCSKRRSRPVSGRIPWL
jgi:hypothetical protein